jgi:hypothetical protein
MRGVDGGDGGAFPLAAGGAAARGAAAAGGRAGAPVAAAGAAGAAAALDAALGWVPESAWMVTVRTRFGSVGAGDDAGAAEVVEGAVG